MYNNDKNLQLYTPKPLSKALFQWLDEQIHEIYTITTKKINLSVVANDIFLQPFLPKFLLKVSYDFFSKTQLMDFIDSTILRKSTYNERKSKFIRFIQKYLHFHQRRKLTRIYKTFLFNNKNESQKQNISHQVIKLLLFIAIKSQNKNEFIERIFSMPTQYQQSLMDDIMEVQNILQSITEKQELILQFNSLKKQNTKMKDNYQELVDYQNKLLDQCEKQDFSKESLQNKNYQNRNQKIGVCECLGITDIQRPYLKIYKNLQDKNQTLSHILVQKQKKQNQLLDQHYSLKYKSDEFQDVLFQLKQQKKKLKIILNDKKNQSFQLEMRASLRLSQQKENFRKSQAIKRKSYAHLKNVLKDVSNHGFLCNNEDNRLRTKSKQEQFSQINQSVNILSKIEELKQQKESLIKELENLKILNISLKKKDNSSKVAFNQLQKIYSQILSLCPQNQSIQNALKKQRSKTTFKTINNRYFLQIESNL